MCGSLDKRKRSHLSGKRNQLQLVPNSYRSVGELGRNMVQGVAIISLLLATVAILLQQWMVLSQPSEQSLLYDFYNSTSGWDDSCSGGWSTNTTPLCSGNNSNWAKVSCSGGKVTRIELRLCNIHGTLPSQWSSLTDMTLLNLYSNSLSGTLPSQWSSLTNMAVLDLSDNSFSGTLPAEWSNLTTINRLSLERNSLSGTLPLEWSKLKTMLMLYLPSNFLSGTLPPAWSKLTNMLTLHLYSNSLSGTLPPEWSNLTNMLTLYLYSNSLSGTLPPQWSSLANLDDIRLYSNSLSGTLPPEWSNLARMVRVVLSSNSLSGTLPPQWSSMTNILFLELSLNSFNGTLPPQWSNLTKMLDLRLYSNSLSGTLPLQWCSLTNLRYLFIDRNSLSGTLPLEWSSMASILEIRLFNNSLSGILPPRWSNLTNMQTLFLFDNSLSGSLPPQWSNLTSMQTLWLYDNSLSGSLPPQWSNLTSMQTLWLYDNSLSGSLPPQWNSMSSIEDLRLYNNTLTGSLPSQWNNLTKLRILDVRSNFLSGALPWQWGNMSPSLACDVSGNCLNSPNASTWWLTFPWRNIGSQRVDCPLSRNFRSTRTPSGSHTYPSTSRFSHRLTLSSESDLPVSITTSEVVGTNHSDYLIASHSLSLPSSPTTFLPTVSLSRVVTNTDATGNLSLSQPLSSLSWIVPSSTRTIPSITTDASLSLIGVNSRTSTTLNVGLPVIALVFIFSPLVVGSVGAGSGGNSVQVSDVSLQLRRRMNEGARVDGIGMSLLENPLQLSLSGFPLSLQMTGGAVVGNVVVCVLVVICSAVLLQLWHGRRCGASAFQELRSRVFDHLPGALLPPASLLLLPTLSSSLSLIISPHRTAGTCVMGVLGSIGFVGALVWATAAVRRGLLNGRASCTPHEQATRRSTLSMLFSPRCEWAPSTQAQPDVVFCRRFGPFFSDYTKRYSMYFAFELWSTVGAALVAAVGLSLEGSTVAMPASVVLGVIAFSRFAAAALLRPLSVLSSNAVAATLEALGVVCVVLSITVATDAGDEIASLLAAQAILTAAPGLLNLLVDARRRFCVVAKDEDLTVSPPARIEMVSEASKRQIALLHALVIRICDARSVGRDQRATVWSFGQS